MNIHVRLLVGPSVCYDFLTAYISHTNTWSIGLIFLGRKEGGIKVYFLGDVDVVWVKGELLVDALHPLVHLDNVLQSPADIME